MSPTETSAPLRCYAVQLTHSTGNWETVVRIRADTVCDHELSPLTASRSSPPPLVFKRGNEEVARIDRSFVVAWWMEEERFAQPVTGA